MRMVIAEHKKISNTGIHSNNGRTSVMLRAKNVSTQKNTNKLTNKKPPKKINAAGELKYVDNSRRDIIKAFTIPALLVYLQH